MKELSLTEYLTDQSQAAVARLMGVTRDAVSKMVMAKRDIRIVVDKKGEVVEAYEVKPVGRFKANNERQK